jgi:hypothetical protein
VVASELHAGPRTLLDPTGGPIGAFREVSAMRKLLVSVVCLVAITVGITGSHFTTAQETPATPGVPLMCATPAASPDATAPAVVMNGTPAAGMGMVVASPGAMVGEDCAAIP